MKKILFPFALAGLFVACNSTSGKPDDKASAAQKENALKDSANFTTVIWPDSTFKDLGNIKKGQVVEIPFTVKNMGDKPLVIATVQPGCGCTLAEKPEAPILPGKDGKIVAKFNSEGQSEGSHTKNMVVHANTKPFTETVLNFKVNIVN